MKLITCKDIENETSVGSI